MIFTAGLITGIVLIMVLRVVLYRLNLESHRRTIANIEKQLKQWQN